MAQERHGDLDIGPPVMDGALVVLRLSVGAVVSSEASGQVLAGVEATGEALAGVEFTLS
jgi:hypothetical protein